MSELMKDFFLEFVNTTGISEELSSYFYLGSICAVVLGVLACVLGFRTYRAFFSAVLFMITAIVSWNLMADTESLRSVATCIAVIGSVLAFWGYRWHRMGGFAICFLVGVCVGWMIYPSYLLAAVFGILFGVAELFFPVIAISFATSLWGVWVLSDSLNLSGGLKVLFILGITVISFCWQLFINRKQKLFAKVCPDHVRYWLEQRRK